MGRKWYENGKYLHKKNTFTDFIACAEHLIHQGYTSSPKLCIEVSDRSCAHLDKSLSSYAVVALKLPGVCVEDAMSVSWIGLASDLIGQLSITLC